MRESGVLQVPFVKVVAAIYFLLFTTLAGLAILRPPEEDKMLQRALGEEWENWAKRVKYRLLPGVY
jgi:protein-S-isoprenylcysteine O-methyltransferase Ste14